MTLQPGAPTDFESFLTWEALTDILSYVTWHSQSGRWEASASLDNKRVYLGLFDTIEGAAAARAAFDAKERNGFGPRESNADTDGAAPAVVTSIRQRRTLSE